MTIEEITAEMQAVIDGAEGRSLTDEECAQYENLENDLKAAQKSDEIRKRNTAYNIVRIPAGVPRPASGVEDSYEKAFLNYVRTGKPNADLIQNAQSEGVPSEGGYLVPDGFRQKLIERLKAFGGVAGVAERYTTGTGAPVEWPTLDDTANEGEIVQEGNTFSSGADIVFGSNALGAYSYMTGGAGGAPLKVNRELVQDAAFDIQGLLAKLFAKRIGRIQARHWISGTGVSQPLGLLTGRTPIQAAANTGFKFSDFVEWEHGIDPEYRGNARWVFNDTTLKMAKQITDSHGDPIYRGWGANMALGFNEQTLHGYPITIDQGMPDYDADDSTDLAIIFGDIRQGYVIRDVKDVELLVNPYTSMHKRQIEFTAWARADGTQQDTNAYVVGSGKS